MDAIWDRNGQHVGWWDRSSGALFDSQGQKHIGFAANGGVYSVSGQHKGLFDDGFFKDDQGNPVAFVEGATGGPSLPPTGMAPYVGSTPYVGGAPYLQNPSWSPPTTWNWSGSS